MIELKDLETDAGNAEFAGYLKSVKNYARSRGFAEAEAEEIAQETSFRVLQKLNGNEISQVNGGYFIRVADFIFLEMRRKYAVNQRRFVSPTGAEDETEPPPDAKLQAGKFENEKERAILNDCILECFQQRNRDEQVLLRRYNFDEKFTLETEEPDSYKKFLGTVLDSIREIRSIFLPPQEEHTPITDDVRLKIFRIREKMRKCVKNCIARKKSFA